MPAVQVSVQARLVLRPVRAQRTVELGLHAALVLEMPGQAGVVAIDLAAIPAGVRHPLAIQITHRAPIWKMKEHRGTRLESIVRGRGRLFRLREFVHSVRIEKSRLFLSTMSRV